ncbi:hypothetical protein GJ496_006850 [Pomphorhynchus laevis]|nr:hypothetical protein GJ496_006850 [Pomphorhynchus laevis]
MKRLCYNGLAPVNETVREKLLNLHPQNGIYRLQSDTCLDAGFQVNSLIVDCSLVRAAIFSFPSTSASSCLELRPEHLQDLLTSDLSGSFLQRITSLVNTLLGGGGHESVARYLCGANLIALVKEPDGVRPIAAGKTLRRLCSKCACRKLSTVFLSVLQPTQLGVAIKNRVDSIIHIVRDEHTRRRDKDDWRDDVCPAKPSDANPNYASFKVGWLRDP